MKDVLAALRAIGAMLLKWAGPAAALLPWAAPFAGLFGILATVVTLADSLTVTLNQLAAAIRPLPTSSVLNMANYMYPVAESIAIFGMLLTLKIACTTIRLVKSWIPTVS